MAVHLWMLYYAHARLDDLDRDAMPQWVGKGKQISVACSRQVSKQ